MTLEREAEIKEQIRWWNQVERIRAQGFPRQRNTLFINDRNDLKKK